jgi:Kef-type K+ transport system membrane component KefB
MIERPIGECIAVGACFSLSSTAVVLKCLTREEMESKSGHILLGILVIQDVFLGIMLATLELLDRSGTELLLAILKLVGAMLLFMLLAYVTSTFLLSFYLNILKSSGNHEIFLLGIVFLCLVALKTTQALNLSMEMGCFVAGLLLSVHKGFVEKSILVIEPIRDVFAALFFSSIGLHIYPSFMLQEAGVLLVFAITTMAFKFMVCLFVLAFLFRYDWATSITVCLGMVQISEFAFVLASRAKSMEIISREIYYILLSTTALSLLISPLLWKTFAPLISDKTLKAQETP